jgi:hypothetical protein
MPEASYRSKNLKVEGRLNSSTIKASRQKQVANSYK